MKKILLAASMLIIIILTIIVNNSLFNKKEKNKKINLVIAAKARTLDPARAFDDDSLVVIGQSLETLYQYHYLKRPYEVIPSLADGMPVISQNGRVYTIKIKANVKYHQNQKFLKINRHVTAHDFVTQIKRMAYTGTKSLGSWLFSGKIKGFNKFRKKVKGSYLDIFSNEMEGVEALDDLTLRIELNQPEPNLLYFLSMTFVSPVPRELVEKYNNEISDVLVGTGPYYLESFNNESYQFKKSLDFRKEVYPSSGDRYANTQKLLEASSKTIPFIEELEFKVVPKEDERWEMFMRGELDILSVPKKYLDEVSNNSEDFQNLKRQMRFDVKYFSTVSTRWLGFNMKDPLYGKNRKLREAIAFAINYDEYIGILTNNTNLKANSIFNPSIPGYRPSSELPYSYDVKKAKKLMKEAGFEGRKLELTYSTRGKQKVHEVEAGLLKKYLAVIGIELKVNRLEFSEFLKKGREGKLQFFTDNWIYDYPDVENKIQLLISKNIPGINKSGYQSEIVDSLYERLAESLSPELRFELMNQVEKQVNIDIPWIMLMYDSSYVLHSSRVKNFRKSFFIRNYVKYIEKH